MPRTGPFNDNFGNSYTASDWEIVYHAVDRLNNSLTVTWACWRDAAARQANLSPLATHTLVVTGQEFIDAIKGPYPTVKAALYGLKDPFFAGFADS